MLTLLNTLVRGKTREATEQFADANALTLFKQEIYDAEQHLLIVREDLTRLVAEKIQLQKSCAGIEEHIRQREEQAVIALKKQEQSLADELGQIIIDGQKQLAERRQDLAYLYQRETELKTVLKEMSDNIRQYKRELVLAENDERIRKTTSRQPTVHVRQQNTFDKLDNQAHRLRERRERAAIIRQAAREVARDLDENTLDQRLQDKGIIENIELKEVMARLQQKADNLVDQK